MTIKHRGEKYTGCITSPLIWGPLAVIIVVVVSLAGCTKSSPSATHTPKPVFTTQAEKNAEHKAETAFLGCVQQDHLTALLSHSGRVQLAGCMGFKGTVKANLVTCLQNQALNAGSLLTSADRARVKAAMVSCVTTAELAVK